MRSEPMVGRHGATKHPFIAVSSLLAKWKESYRRFIICALFHTGALRLVQLLAATKSKTYSARRRTEVRPPFQSKYGILCYHRVGTEGVPLFSRLDPGAFENQMSYLRKHYRIISLAQLCRELQEPRPAKPTLAVTFDDGYRDLYRYAFPVLRKYEIPATIYLVAQCVDTGEAPWYDRIFVATQTLPEKTLEIKTDRMRLFEMSSAVSRAQAAWEIICYLRSIPDRQRIEWSAAFEKRFPVRREEVKNCMLDWTQVQTMQRDGICFGAHTMTHPSVSRLDPRALDTELNGARKLLEAKLDAPVLDFAYPFGKPEDCSLAAEDLLVRSGYRSAATTTSGVNVPGTSLWRLCRMQIGDDPSLCTFAFTLTRTFVESLADRSSSSKLDALREATTA
jgi:peptidoglycan/xylan/chitin deacetylase (PgdA/CDA1 family)